MHESQALVCLDPIQTTIDEAIGQDECAEPLPEIDRLTPLEALEGLTLEALQRPPCLIMFSGGLDSSTLLAAATRVARREGLPLPVPATIRFPGIPETDESAWQEAVLRELRLTDWHRRDLVEEIDLLGPAAQATLRRHGPHVPVRHLLLAALPGGCLLGHADDRPRRGRVVRRLAVARVLSLAQRQATFRRGDGRRLVNELAPIPLRRWWFGLHARCTARWLRPGPAAELACRTARAAAEEPFSWGRRVAWLARSRLRLALRQATDVLAVAAGARAVHAFLDPVLLAAVARHAPFTGFRHRNRAMAVLFGDAVPAAVASRRDKADVRRVYWGPRSREFAESWSGTGLPDELIDPAALRREWLEPRPDDRSALLLHAAWLADRGGNPPDPVNCRLC